MVVSISRMWLRAGIIAGMMMSLAGCQSFFPALTTTTPVTTTGGNFVYVANETTLTVAGYAVATSTAGVASLAAITGSPYALAQIPTAMAITPSDSFLYVAAVGGIYGYAINATSGVLTALNSGGPLILTSYGSASIDVSPDGQWLFGLSDDNLTLYEYAINTTTGVLASQTSLSYVPAGGATVSAKMVKVAPNGGYVFVALGTGGDLVVPLTTSTGALGSYLQLATGSSTTSDNALAVSSGTTYLYIARSGASTGVAVYSIASGGGLTPVTGSPFAAGPGPFSVQLDSTGAYVYVGNRTDGTISGFSIGTGSVLTALGGSPYASGANVTSLTRDNSGLYILAAALGGSPDLTMYSFDATVPGKLDSAVTAATGTDPVGAIMVVATH